MSECHPLGSSTLPVLLHLYAVELKGVLGAGRKDSIGDYWAGRTVMWLLRFSCLPTRLSAPLSPRNNWLFWAGSQVVLASGALLVGAGHTLKKRGGNPIPNPAVKLCLFHSTRTGTVGRGSSADLNPTFRSFPPASGPDRLTAPGCSEDKWGE